MAAKLPPMSSQTVRGQRTDAPENDGKQSRHHLKSREILPRQPRHHQRSSPRSPSIRTAKLAWFHLICRWPPLQSADAGRPTPLRARVRACINSTPERAGQPDADKVASFVI
jgi:hypothetical protein